MQRAPSTLSSFLSAGLSFGFAAAVLYYFHDRFWWGPDDGPVLVAESDPRVGGQFRVRFRMMDDTEHESRGEYLEVRAPERLAMTWRWLGDEDEGGDSRI